MTNQTFDLLKNLWWMLGVIVVVVLFLVKLGYSLREQKLRIQVL
jgi:hypothetical protein